MALSPLITTENLRGEESSKSTIGQNFGPTIEDYLADCRSRGLSIKTVEDNYGYTLREALLPWLERQGVDSIEAIDDRMLMRWQGDLLSQPGRRGKPISRFSIEGWVKSVNTFLRWAKARGAISHEARGRAPRPPKPLLDILTRQEIDLMEQAAQTERDRLIVRVLADTGLRASELLGLRGSDVIEHERAWFLWVRWRSAKGMKERRVPIPRLAPRLRRFTAANPAGHVFVTLRRRAGLREPLTLSGLQKMIRALGREAGVSKRVHPHLLRHSFATYALSRGMNPIQLADILGHASLAMIMRNYSHLSSRDAYDSVVRLLGGD